jgi:transcriptional regulator with XRE-family HTH domain
MTLGQSIAQHRRAVGLTQVQLADRAGLKRKQLQSIETGRYRHSITVRTLARIAAAAGCTPAALLENVEIE